MLNILKRIDTGVELEIPSPYSYMDEYRAFYGNYMYYTGRSSTSDTYVLYRVNIPNMTVEELGALPSTYSTFVLFNKVPHLVAGNRVYSLDNLTESLYNFYNTSDMYNDNRIDGIEIVDGAMQSMYPKAKIAVLKNATSPVILSNGINAPPIFLYQSICCRKIKVHDP